jgi:putative ABC transport system ATP-binding protein
MDPLIIRNVDKTYPLGKLAVPALRDITVTIRPNCFTVLSGASGSGKTTLLNLIGCIDRPDRGDIVVAGRAVGALSDDALADFRLKHIGFIFQNFNLLPVLNAYENIEYPLLLTRIPAPQRQRRVRELLDAVGLSQHARHWPGQLSGGQRQRVAIARALATAPALVLADEPTANLDSETGAAIIGLMRSVQRAFAATVVFSSHDPHVLAQADDAVVLKDGRIVSVDRRSVTQAADPGVAA